MGANRSYNSPEYKAKQSRLAKAAWKRRLVTFQYSKETRVCRRSGCKEAFEVQGHDPKKYCSNSCAAQVNNSQRRWSEEVKQKISASLKGRVSTSPHYGGRAKVPRDVRICAYDTCAKKFTVERWRKVRYCSNKCAMAVIGGQPTSPKASRGKAGVRTDISATIYFYSRWEANMARLYTHLGVVWEYAPRVFDIGKQRYTPDFYLPETDTYVEVKNFWWKYSIERDRKFRQKYPSTKLHVLLKPEYLQLEERYANRISAWEYRNSAFE